MKKSIIISILISNLLSCLPKNEPDVLIVNKTNVTFDSIRVFANDKNPTTFYSLRENEKVKGKIVFDKNKKGDGCYSILAYKKDSVVISQGFGYYTNGASLDREFNISIMKDTIIVKSK